MGLREWWGRMRARQRCKVSPPSSVVERRNAPAVADTDVIDRKQLAALRQLRRAENRLRALQAEAQIIRGD